MATILDKDLTRESTVKHEDREIQVTLTSDQKISFKLKGMKSGQVSIGIDELYNQLKNNGTTQEKSKSEPNKRDNDKSPVISLNRLRSLSLITNMEYKIKVELEKVISDLLNQEIKLNN